MDIATAAARLKRDPAQVRRWCKDGRLRHKMVPKKGARGGEVYDVDAASVEELNSELAGKSGQAEIAEQRREERRTADDFDVDKVSANLGLNREQTARLRASSDIPKKKAEAILRVEQAFERQNKNLLQSKNLVSLEELQDEHDRIFAIQYRNLKDLIESYVTKFQLTPSEACEARTEFENAMRRIRDELRAIATK